MTRDWLFWALWWVDVGLTFAVLALGNIVLDKNRQIRQLKKVIQWLQKDRSHKIA